MESTRSWCRHKLYRSPIRDLFRSRDRRRTLPRFAVLQEWERREVSEA